MPRGGRRAGTPGTRYPNRSDLSAKPLPITTVPGQGYGMAGQQADAQRMVPMAPAPSPPAPTTASATAAQQPVPAGPPPGAVPFLAPSSRPDEHLMSGAPSGPGPGPEALSIQPPTATIGSLLQTLADNPLASGEIRNLLTKVQGGRV